MKYIYLLVLTLLSATCVRAQVPAWGAKLGNTGTDAGRSCVIAPNGTIYYTGYFSGVADLDPGPGVYNVTSNGGLDIFLACYTPSGGFLWGFSVGGPNNDGTYEVTVDAASNVIIGGFIQSGGIDFDPGSGVTTVPYAGGTGTLMTGDGFVAKYSSTGGFQWAKNLGGSSVYDYTDAVATDEDGNVYVGGTFILDMIISPTITLNSATGGVGYLVKYSPSGNVIWAHNFGQAGSAAVNSSMRSLVVRGGYIYGCGYFGGTSNFTPWTAPTMLTVMGGLVDGFITKHDTAGNLVYVKPVGGTGYDDELSIIRLDAANNIYVTGWSDGSNVVFNYASPGTSTVATPGGGGNLDIILGKFNNSGLYQWGKVIGGPGKDFGWAMDLDNTNVFITGEFSNTVDFDPSGAVANLTSAGMIDMYLGKYDMGGNYLCAFRAGSPGNDDNGYFIAADNAGHLYTCGQFGGTSTDFDPTPGIFPLTSSGGIDAYFIKYDYTTSGSITGTVAGDTICAGDTAKLTITTTTGGPGPFTVTYTDGTGTHTVTGVMSGVPFVIIPTPATTTTYTITSVISAVGGLCSVPVGSGFGSATIVVGGSATISGNAPICPGATLTLTGATTGGTWSISPTSVATISASGVVTGVASGTAVVSYTTGCGTATVIVTVNTIALAISGNTPICVGSTITLSSSSGGVWSISPSYIASISSSGVVTGLMPGTATVSYSTGCGNASAIVTVNTLPGTISGNAPMCSGGTISLSSSSTGGAWSATPASVATIGTTGVVTGVGPGTAIVSYTTACGAATVVVTVNAATVTISGNSPICFGSSLPLTASVAGGTWSVSPTSIATITPSGVVTGIAGGTATVSYTTVCGSATIVVTVNSSSATIAGNTPLCTGGSIILTSSAAGGTWSCAPATVATISAGGVVTGVAAGTATVAYASTCGVTTAIVTVNGAPATITGNLPMCIASSITLSNTTIGGTWSISPSSVATISSTGVVTGLTGGTATVTYAGQCGVATTIVTINTTSAITGNVPLCQGQSILLHATVAGGTWSNSTTAVAIVNPTGLVTGVAAGTAMITYTSACGPTYAIGTVNPSPTVTAYANTPCEGDSLVLTASSSPGVSFSWTGPSGFSSGGDVAIIDPATVLNAGNYFVTATLATCSSAPFPVVVTIKPAPHASGITSGNPTTCSGSDGWIKLLGLTAGSTFTVTYKHNGTVLSVNATADLAGSVTIPGLVAGTYYDIILVSSEGCSSVSMGPVTLTYTTPAPVLSSNQPVCEGDDLYLFSTDPGSGTFSWQAPDGFSSLLQYPIRNNVLPSATGIYTLTYTVDTCPVTATTFVKVYPKTILVNVVPDLTVPYGTTVQLYAYGAIYYRWVGDATISNPNINNPVVRPDETTTYTVYGMNEGGCPDTAHVTITVNDDATEFIPSAFTPNGDGQNDVFKPLGLRYQKLVEFSVYNRWGERVYYNTYDKEKGWDGTYKGVLQDIGVYNYYIIVGMRDNSLHIYKGDVTLIR